MVKDRELLELTVVLLKNKKEVTLSTIQELMKPWNVISFKQRNAVRLLRNMNKALSDKEQYKCVEFKGKNNRIDFTLNKRALTIFFWSLGQDDDGFLVGLAISNSLLKDLDDAAKKAWKSNPEGMEALTGWAKDSGTKEGLIKVLRKHAA